MRTEAIAFAGERQDGQGGAYYLRTRRYDPHTGRFTQPDPIGYAGGPNLYAYASNNPQTLTDPTGLSPDDPTNYLVPRPFPKGNGDRRTRQGTRNDWTVAFEMTLKRADWGTDDDTHNKRANAALDDALRTDPQLLAKLRGYSPSADGGTLRSNGRRLTPNGWTWHHHATRPGVMQLVLRSEHTASSPFWRLMHPNGRGGYKNWAEPAGAKPRPREH